MELKIPSISEHEPTPRAAVASARRRRRTQENENVRIFLPKTGSTQAKPELGQEMTSEGEALIEALKSGQPFYTVTTWKARAEANGGGNPIIVKEALVRT